MIAATATRTQVLAGLESIGMGWSNTVKPPKHSDQVGREACVVREGPLAGAVVVVSLHAGRASDGYKSDYTARRRWWTLLEVYSAGGHRCWVKGSRFTDERRARTDFDESAEGIREESS